MQSKRSYFNKTLFRKNLTRFWPLWGGLSIAGAFVPLYMLLVLLTELPRGLKVVPDDFAEALYGAVTIFAPAFIMGYAILCAMLIWGYLYSPRSVGLMHTLPVDRTCLFITNTASGLAMMAIPFAVVGGLTGLLALFFGFFQPTAFINTVAAVIFMAVLFFGLATLCAMLTGHNAVLPVLYLLVNFLARIVEMLVSYMASQFLLGVTMSAKVRSLALTPILRIYTGFNAFYKYPEDSGGIPAEAVPALNGLGMVALYGLAGLGLLALAWLLYRKRQSERAGDIVAYRPLRPVFRYGIALLSALTLGQLLYELLWNSIFADRWTLTADLIPTIVCMSIAGVIGYYIASMLLEKSLRVFKGSWKGVLTICAGVVILCGVISMDPIGLENKVPALDDVERIYFGGVLDLDVDTSTEDGRKMAEQALDIHRTILSDKAYIYQAAANVGGYGYSGNYDSDPSGFSSVWIQYTMKDGSSLARIYTLPFFASRMEDPNTYDGKLYQLTHSEAALVQKVAVPEGSLMRVNVYADGWFVESGDASERLYEALLKDAREEHISVYFPFWEEDSFAENCEWYNVELELIYNVPGNTGSASGGKSVTLRSTMTHTIDALVEEGYFTQEEMESIQKGDYEFIERVSE